MSEKPKTGGRGKPWCANCLNDKDKCDPSKPTCREPMIPETKRCCKTCQHSKWELTPTGQIKRNSTGRCQAPPPETLPKVPFFLRYELEQVLSVFHERIREWQRGIIPEDGDNCECWEPKE